MDGEVKAVVLVLCFFTKALHRRHVRSAEQGGVYHHVYWEFVFVEWGCPPGGLPLPSCCCAVPPVARLLQPRCGLVLGLGTAVTVFKL